MNSKVLLISVIAISTLSGCLELPSKKNDSGAQEGVKQTVYSGLMRSVDKGRIFDDFNKIDAGDKKRSLAKMNILSFAIDPSNTDVLFVGTATKGVYRSRDGGVIWEQLENAPRNAASLALNPHDANVIYASAIIKKRGHLFKSEDQGETWKSIYVEPREDTRVNTIAFSPVDGNTIYIGTTKGKQSFATIARSRDGGGTWENVLTKNASIEYIAFDAVDENTLYASLGTTSVLKSRNGGTDWMDVRKIKREKTEKLYQGKIHAVVAHPHEPGVLYVGTNKGVFISSDYGRAWEELDVIASTKGIPIRALTVNPHDRSQIAYVAAKAIYVKVGDSWAITDTRSDRSVSFVMYDPVHEERMYIGFRK